MNGFVFLGETHRKFSDKVDIGQRIRASVKGFFAKFPTAYSNYKNSNQAPNTADCRHDADESTGLELEELNSVQGNSENNFVKDDVMLAGKKFLSKVLLQILSLSLLTFHKVSSDVLVPIFLASARREPLEHRPLSGGLGVSIEGIGYLLLSQAIVAAATQTLLIPRIISWVGVLKLYRWTLFRFPWLYGLLPLTVVLPYSFAIAILALLQWCSVLLSSTEYVCCAIL